MTPTFWTLDKTARRRHYTNSVKAGASVSNPLTDRTFDAAA